MNINDTKENSNNLKENLTEAILSSWGKFCSICGTQRNEKNVQVVYTYADGAMIHLDCFGCQRQFVLNVMGMGFQMVPLLTDLNNNEIEKFSNTNAVSIDDIIEVHTVLFQSNNADLLTEKFHTSSPHLNMKIS